MSRIFKAPNVTIDKDNVISIEVMNSSHFAQAVKPLPEPETAYKENEDTDYKEKPEKIIERAEKEAEAILKKARDEAQKIEKEIKAHSEAEAEKLYEASRQEGHEQGYQDGVRESEDLKRQARQVHEDALAQKEELLNTAEGELIQLMLRILKKLLGDAIHMNPMVILHLVKQGLYGATISGDINIHVSGDDYDEVLRNRDEFLPLTDGSVKMEFLKDLSLNQGDCIIETPFGNIDCSVDRQFASLKQDLYYILENSAHENN